MNSDRLSAPEIEDLRLLVYTQLATMGRVETTDQLADRLYLTPTQVAAGLHTLHTSRDLVLDDTEQIVLAHPFATANFGFSVMGEATIWWGGCAWDAFAIPHLVDAEPDTLVATRCPQCRTPHAWNVTRAGAPDGDQIVHFATPMARVWNDVVHGCQHQRIFCDDHCLDLYLTELSPTDPGFRFDIPTLWNLARHWYEGRLDRGYQRRDPASAATYFASVGLTGPFWAAPAAETQP
ncbi:MAG: organomercurial lyase [Mycobacterium sp.]